MRNTTGDTSRARRYLFFHITRAQSGVIGVLVVRSILCFMGNVLLTIFGLFDFFLLAIVLSFLFVLLFLIAFLASSHLF
jgi:hypothetical protein